MCYDMINLLSNVLHIYFSNHNYVNINSVFLDITTRLKCNLNYCETVQEYFIRIFFLYQALSVILYFFFFFIANRFFHGIEDE